MGTFVIPAFFWFSTDPETPLFKMKLEYIILINLRKGVTLGNKMEKIFGILNQLEGKDTGHYFLFVYKYNVTAQKPKIIDIDD